MMHGGDIYSFIRETGKAPLDFSENTNPYGLPERVKQAIKNEVNKFNMYPDPHCVELTKHVAKYYSVPEDCLLFGNGAADIIFKIAYAMQPKSALILAPTFSEYELSLKNIGTEIHHFHLDEQEEFRITEAILEVIPGHDIVYICNPNNPTGRVCPRDLMKQIANACKAVGAILVVDECFMDFVTDMEQYSMLEEVAQYDNVILLKAFTKIFAMAGLRLGFCVTSNEELLTRINEAGQPWSVSTVAQVAGVACCEEEEYVQHMRIQLPIERKFLSENLQKLGMKVYHSDANYLLFHSKIELAEPLRKSGIMLRSCGNYRGLNQEYYRVAVKKHEENQELIMRMKQIIERGNTSEG